MIQSKSKVLLNSTTYFFRIIWRSLKKNTLPVESHYSTSPLGDSALEITLGSGIEQAVNSKVLAAYQLIKSSEIKGILDIVPAYCSLVIHFDPLQKGHPGITAYDYFISIINDILQPVDLSGQSMLRSMSVPVCYALKFGIDLQAVSSETNLEIEEIISLHCSRTYRVYMIGFLPGFAYMGEVDARIASPRLAIPRLRVEAGSVGIADKQTGIYPLDSPGGWKILGRTPLTIFNKQLEAPVYFNPGDAVQFYPITEHEFESY